jgi:hypothetical protein
LQEDAVVISALLNRCPIRARGLIVGLLLLSLSACGLSDYEEKMRETQEREERLREETRYLDAPIKIQTEKKEEREVPVANVFFRPPRGIQAAFLSDQVKGLLWRYPGRPNGGEFLFVELAFGDDDKEFASKVLSKYQASGGTQQSARQLTPPGRDKPVVFDVWDFDNGQEGYSVNILRGGRTQVAVVYAFPRVRRDNVRKAIDLSLESLGVDGAAYAARKRYEQKSPWQLTAAPGP